MSISRSQQPNRWSAVYSPIIYEFLSSFGTGYQIEPTLTPSSINSTNGFLTINFAGAHNIVAGDYVYISSDYSGAYRVISAPLTTSIIVDADDTVGNAITGVYKYAYQYNASVKVWANINSVWTDLGYITNKPIDDGTDIRFTFDVSVILRNYITSNIPDLQDSNITLAPDAFKEFYIQYREEYIQGVGGYPVYVEGDWETDYSDSYYDINEKIAVNATEQYVQQIGNTYKQQSYVLGSGSTTHYLLTNQPDGLEYCSDSKYWIYFNNEAVLDIETLQVIFKQYNGTTLLETNNVDISNMLVGQHFIEISSANFTLNPSATTFTVQVSFDGDETEPISYTVDQNCTCIDSQYQVLWLNNKGGYSSYYFTGRATHGIEIERNGQFKNDISQTFAPTSRGYGNTRNVTRERITLRNETSNRSIHDWLVSDIASSIDVWIKQTIDGTDYLLPLTLDLDSVDIRKDKDKRFTFTVDALYAFDKINQTK